MTKQLTLLALAALAVGMALPVQRAAAAPQVAGPTRLGTVGLDKSHLILRLSP